MSSGAPGDALAEGSGARREEAPSAAPAAPQAMPRGTRRLPVEVPVPVTERQIVRFSVHQRAQHFLMMTSVLLLVLTGLPQKFYDWPASQLAIRFFGGADNARGIHHFAGWLMLAAAAYHLVWLACIAVARRRLPTRMVPTLGDARDFAQNTAYCLGMADEKARIGRYSYLEKFDYLAVFWGVPLMGLTGLILMFPLEVTTWLPGVALPVATIAHSDEAVLATGWLLVVHFYNAHFAPHIFPFNRSIFTGRVPEHLYKLEHPLDYEEQQLADAMAPEASRSS
ncbi:MAG: cytochrome C [Candidatus Sericytochromatia bacterium]|nr:cytochrome C [Candidatus Tanganyikabacteria bacterium]